MTTTYDLSTAVGKVRLKIGDTSTTFAFTDEEIQIFLDASSENVNYAAADACDAWAAKYAQNAKSEKIGNYSYTQKTVDDLLTLSKRFGRTIRSSRG